MSKPPQAPVVLRPAMDAVQSTWLGVVPADTPYLNPETIDPSNLPGFAIAALGSVEQREQREPPPPVEQPRQKFAPPVVGQPFIVRPAISDPIDGQYAVSVAPVLPENSPRVAYTSAKARIKVIRAELRRMKALQQELAGLERMVEAYRSKPKQNIRALRSA